MDVTTTAKTDTTVTLAWSQPTDAGGDISYVVELSGNGGKISETITRNGTSFSHMFSGLIPFTRYSVSLVASSRHRCELSVTTSEGGMCVCDY